MPTLAPPVLDHGGDAAPAPGRRAVRPLQVVAVFVVAVIVTVVGMRLVFGPLGGGGGGDDGGRAGGARGEPATTGGWVRPTVSTTDPSGVMVPPTQVYRPEGVFGVPEWVARQFVLEYLTVLPAEPLLVTGERVRALVTPELALALAVPLAPSDRPGRLVEVGPAVEIEPGVFELRVWPWTYRLGGEAERQDREVWRVEVRTGSGVWLVADATRV